MNRKQILFVDCGGGSGKIGFLKDLLDSDSVEHKIVGLKDLMQDTVKGRFFHGVVIFNGYDFSDHKEGLIEKIMSMSRDCFMVGFKEYDVVDLLSNVGGGIVEKQFVHNSNECSCEVCKSVNSYKWN